MKIAAERKWPSDSLTIINRPTCGIGISERMDDFANAIKQSTYVTLEWKKSSQINVFYVNILLECGEGDEKFWCRRLEF